ncbi:hypothetical protein [Chromobacterium violaceum]|uniref:hypothetical protein n=1 Tax=Chromobacterium violaceum TaxID=536 RepID=UPI001B31EAA4|nr:hypothetical protein [Chromobacterium violaceum]MBP4043935.1 hypothetical protein [Chromobacterium violaceum]
MKSIFSGLLVGLAFVNILGCEKEKESVDNVVVVDRSMDRPTVYAEKKNGILYINLKQGVEEAKKNLGAKRIEFASLSILKPQVKDEKRKGWVLLNNAIPLSKCQVEMPDVMKYGEKVSDCLTVERHDDYDKSVNYEIYLTGVTDKLIEVEFHVEYKRYY